MEVTLKTVLKSTGYPVYANSVPTAGDYPCIVYKRVSTYEIRSHSGSEIERPRFQVSCWAKKYSEALSVSEAVKAKLNLNQVNFKLATKENELDDEEKESKLHRRILDFYMWN